jgi:predicted Fe-Mo cluster-binding NifX family protein
MDKTKIAIPVFGLHVSPRCDCAPEILFLEFEDGKLVSRARKSMEGMNSLQRIRTISASGVTLLICGALPGFFRRMIEAQGIRIIHTEVVEIDVLIEHLKWGELNSMVPRAHGGRRKHGRDGCPWMDSKECLNDNGRG